MPAPLHLNTLQAPQTYVTHRSELGTSLPPTCISFCIPSTCPVTQAWNLEILTDNSFILIQSVFSVPSHLCSQCPDFLRWRSGLHPFSPRWQHPNCFPVLPPVLLFPNLCATGLNDPAKSHALSIPVQGLPLSTGNSRANSTAQMWALLPILVNYVCLKRKL